MTDQNIYSPPTADLETVAPQDLVIASRWTRLGAAMLDSILLMILFFPPLFFLYGNDLFNQLALSQNSYSNQLLFSLFTLSLYLLVNGYFLATSGQTVGKKMVGIKIVDSGSMQILPFWKVFGVRYLPVFVASQIPVIGQFLNIIDSLFIFRSDRRCLHDMIADTKVIYVKPQRQARPEEISSEVAGKRDVCDSCGTPVDINFGDAYKTLCKNCT